MFATGDMVSFAKYYKENTGSSLKDGMWSFLITQNSDQSRRIFEQSFSAFNSQFGSDWHLIAFLNSEGDPPEVKWLSDPRMDKALIATRKYFDSKGPPLPAASIVFFNPYSDGKDSTIVVVPLDIQVILNNSGRDIYDKGFNMVYRIIMDSSNESNNRHLQMHKSDFQKMEDRLNIFSEKLRKEYRNAYFVKISKFIFQEIIKSGLDYLVDKITGR